MGRVDLQVCKAEMGKPGVASRQARGRGARAPRGGPPHPHRAPSTRRVHRASSERGTATEHAVSVTSHVRWLGSSWSSCLLLLVARGGWQEAPLDLVRRATRVSRRRALTLHSLLNTTKPYNAGTGIIDRDGRRGRAVVVDASSRVARRGNGTRTGRVADLSTSSSAVEYNVYRYGNRYQYVASHLSYLC